MVKVDITPDKSLMPKLGSSGYSIPQAIAELIDNAIDARAEEGMEISIKLLPDKISIADRGIGMNFKQIKDAIVLARSSKKGKLGEFGLGLKTSCLSLGKNFTIISKKLGEEKEFKVEFDGEKRLDHEKWELEVSERERPEDEHYTIIEVTDLKVKVLHSLADHLVRDVQMRFSHFLSDVSIKINNKRVHAVEIDIDESTKVDIDITTKYGSITGWVALMIDSSQKGLYGLHSYRNKRLIMPYNKIGFSPHPTVARIFGEINLNFVPVTHNKKSFETASEEYKLSEELLTEKLRPLLIKAREAKSKERQTKEVTNQTKARSKNTSQAMNEVVLEVSKTNKGITLPSQDIQKVDTDITISGDRPIPKIQTTIAEEKEILHINFAGKDLSFIHSYQNIGAEYGWKAWKYDSKSKLLHIVTNADFPTYFACDDLPFLASLHIAESLTEFLLEGRDNAKNIDDYKQIFMAILRLSSEMKEDL